MKQARIDSLLKKAASGTTTVKEDRELKQLHEEKMEFLAKGYSWDVPKFPKKAKHKIPRL